MPVVFREAGYRFHFFSNEGDPREPAHVHVTKDGADAKVWLYPLVEFAYNRGFVARTQRWILSVVEARRDEIEEVWNDHFA
mgnify:CR=1 FL=1